MNRTFTVDLCNAEGCSVVLRVKRLWCSKCRITGYCSKSCQVSSWPSHKKLCGKKECCDTIRQEIMHVNHGTYMYNVVIKLYQEAAWGEIIHKKNSIVDQLNSVCGSVDSYSNNTRMSSMIGEAYHQTGDMVKAVYYYKLSKAITDRQGYPNTVLCRKDRYVAYQNLADIFKHLGEFVKSMSIYKEMEHMVANTRSQTSMAAKGMGDCFYGMGEYQQAMSCFLRTVHIVLLQEDPFYRKRYNVSIGNTWVAMRKYSRALNDFSGSYKKDMNKTEQSRCFDELQGFTCMHYGIALWAYSRELKQLIYTQKTAEKTPGFLSRQLDRYKFYLKDAESTVGFIAKKLDIVGAVSSSSRSFVSYISLSYACVLYDNKKKDEAVQFLRMCLDTEILIGARTCKFCEQLKANDDVMLKCSECKVARFCNKFCQEGTYAKRMHPRMGIMILHQHLCPLLKQWKQVKHGRATVASCVENHLLFLKRCDPLREILDRNDFVDDYVE